MNVPFYRHQVPSEYSERIKSVLETPFLTSGNVGKAVEQQLCEFFGAPHALLTNSCTNGGIAVLLALGIGPGDEVIVPAMTFVATANMVELVGAKPMFIDADPDTLLITPEGVVSALTQATRAVMPVHMYGQMIDIERLRRALDDAGRKDVAIVEDAAHCFEGTFAGDPPGKFSDAAVYSFYATKNVTCGEGGAVVTFDSGLCDKLMQTRLHGMSAGAVDRFKDGGYRHWDMLRLGTKANLPDILAVMLPPQIDTIRERLPVREALCRRYEEAFAGTPIRCVKTVPEAINARHLFPIHVESAWRDRLIGEITQNGIGATVNYRSVPTTTYYRERYGLKPNAFPVSYEWGEGTLSLPMFPGLNDSEQQCVIDAVLSQVDSLSRESRAAN
jgi:dTDP-4-amino-4,6-dideoxygalactose transaminase